MTSSDRQLLERAAKAAGYEVARESDTGRGLLLIGVQHVWNPLDDDGDALRLAVKLNIQIAPDPANRMGCAWLADESDAEPIEETIAVELWRNSDEYAATRRAIVRAAASMGEHK